MKPLLFIGAALMVGAGIYGFVDYKKKEQSAAFKTLYKEEKPVAQQPVPPVVTTPVPDVVEEKKEPVVETKENTTNRHAKRKGEKFLPKNFSRAIPAEVVKEEEVPAEVEPTLPQKEL